MSQIFMYLTLFLYGCATVAYLVYLNRTTPLLASWSHRLITTGFIAHLLSIVHYFNMTGHLPVSDLQESLSFLSLVIVGAFILFERSFKVAILGAFIIPLAMLMLVVSSLFPQSAGQFPPAPLGRLSWIHIILALFSYAMFAISCGASVMYLIQQHFLKKKRFGSMFRKLPSLDMIDSISFRCLVIGFPLLTLAILAGIVRSEMTIGRLWSMSDPRQAWTMAAWTIYTVLLYGRVTIGWRGRKAALLSVLGFVVLLVTLIASRHNINWYP